MKIEKELEFKHLPKVNRIELISEKGREFVLSQKTVQNVKVSLQDDKTTLKIFYNNNKKG